MFLCVRVVKKRCFCVCVVEKYFCRGSFILVAPLFASWRTTFDENRTAIFSNRRFFVKFAQI
jgi:hypothetical protein